MNDKTALTAGKWTQFLSWTSSKLISNCFQLHKPTEQVQNVENSNETFCSTLRKFLRMNQIGNDHAIDQIRTSQILKVSLISGRLIVSIIRSMDGSMNVSHRVKSDLELPCTNMFQKTRVRVAYERLLISYFGLFCSITMIFDFVFRRVLRREQKSE